MNDNFYRQCLLERNGTRQVSWIPNKYAYVGNLLRLKEDGHWLNGWVVKEAWQICHESQLPDPHAERKAHKVATGDSQ